MVRRHSLVALVLMALIAVSAFAHEGIFHVLGTVTASSSDQLVVQTKDGKSVSIRLTPDTRYRAIGATASSTPSVGDRVVVEVMGNSNGMTASEVRFSSVAPKKAR